MRVCEIIADNGVNSPKVKCGNRVPLHHVKCYISYLRRDSYRRYIKATSRVDEWRGKRIWSFDTNNARGDLYKQWQNWKSLHSCSLIFMKIWMQSYVLVEILDIFELIYCKRTRKILLPSICKSYSNLILAEILSVLLSNLKLMMLPLYRIFFISLSFL